MVEKKDRVALIKKFLFFYCKNFRAFEADRNEVKQTSNIRAQVLVQRFDDTHENFL